MDQHKQLEVFIKVIQDLPGGIGIFHVEDLTNIKNIRYVFMNSIILHEMRKTKEEVFGKYIHEVAPEAYEHEVGLQVIESYVKVARDKESINLGVVEYSNELVAGLYECSIHHIVDNYIYVLLRNVTELENSKKQLRDLNKNLEHLVQERTAELEDSKRQLEAINNTLEDRVQRRTASLEEKNKHLEHFSYIASHDLQEPINTIQTFIGLIHEEYEGSLDEEFQRYLGYISESSSRMKTLVTSLLDFSRLGRTSESTEVDCKEIVEDVLMDLTNQIESAAAIVQVETQLPKIIGYDTELRLLFQNLISNAIKFADPSKQSVIKIRVKETNGWTFTIEDNGIGIPQKDLENIFGLFHRLHKKNTYEGTGIGLAQCRRIIDMHNGKIWATSQLGKGSMFSFYIPKSIHKNIHFNKKVKGTLVYNESSV
ncbi:MAG: hypothetical protein CMB99_03525 [Flavobacteriaceae bacterium]|nr:hypothetical protein [Flavobacteriaceae bacterium]|tara:strand:+ start:151190 stop:152467 length:1278 start_codon:yes stop_codon:yes gene_type:complete